MWCVFCRICTARYASEATTPIAPISSEIAPIASQFTGVAFQFGGGEATAIDSTWPHGLRASWTHWLRRSTGRGTAQCAVAISRRIEPSVALEPPLGNQQWNHPPEPSREAGDDPAEEFLVAAERRIELRLEDDVPDHAPEPVR